MRADGKPTLYNLFTCSLSTLDFEKGHFKAPEDPLGPVYLEKEHTAHRVSSHQSPCQMRISQTVFQIRARGKEQGRESLAATASSKEFSAGNHGQVGATACALAAEPENKDEG